VCRRRRPSCISSRREGLMDAEPVLKHTGRIPPSAESPMNRAGSERPSVPARTLLSRSERQQNPRYFRGAKGDKVSATFAEATKRRRQNSRYFRGARRLSLA
jgi:hypothetical protein